MIRVLVIGSTLLITQAVPAFAEKITLACTNRSDHNKYTVIFDMDAHTVMEGTASWPVRITDAEVVWQEPWGSTGAIESNNYNRETSQLHFSVPRGASMKGFDVIADCVRAK